MRRYLAAMAIAAFLCTPAIASDQNPYSGTALAEAEGIRAAHEHALMSVPGVQGVGIGEKDGELALLILTHRHADLESLASVFAVSVGAMPIVWKEIDAIVAEQVNLGTSTGNGILCVGPSEPPVGATGNFCDVGTIGYKVCDNTNATVGGWITNNHVAASGCPGKCPNNAALGSNLILEVTSGSAGTMHFCNGSGDHEGPAPASVRIDQ